MKTFLVGILLLFCVVDCFAFRCTDTNQLVDVGATKNEVIKRCGEPKSIETVSERSTIKNKTLYTKTKEVWIIDQSKNYDHVDYRLIFIGDILVELKHIR